MNSNCSSNKIRNGRLDFGIDLRSPVGLECSNQALFRFNGTIEEASVKYLDTSAQIKKVD